MPSPLPLLLLAAFAAIALASIRRVPEGQAYTTRRLGRPGRVLNAGTRWVLPLLDRVTHKISLTGRQLTLDRCAFALQDGARIRASGALYYQVLAPEKADTQVDHLEELLISQMAVALPQAVQDSGANPASREALGGTLKCALNKSLAAHGVLVTRIQLDFTVSG